MHIVHASATHPRRALDRDRAVVFDPDGIDDSRQQCGPVRLCRVAVLIDEPAPFADRLSDDLRNPRALVGFFGIDDSGLALGNRATALVVEALPLRARTPPRR